MISRWFLKGPLRLRTQRLCFKRFLHGVWRCCGNISNFFLLFTRTVHIRTNIDSLFPPPTDSKPIALEFKNVLFRGLTAAHRLWYTRNSYRTELIGLTVRRLCARYPLYGTWSKTQNNSAEAACSRHTRLRSAYSARASSIESRFEIPRASSEGKHFLITKYIN